MKYIQTIKKIIKVSELMDSEINGYLHIENGNLSLKESKVESANKNIIKNSIVFLINDYHYMFKSWKNITKGNDYYCWKYVFYIITFIISVLLIYFAIFQQTHVIWFAILTVALYILREKINTESKEVIIKKMRKIDSTCNDLKSAELVWLEYNFGCSSKFIDKIELLENNSRIYKKYKTDIDLRPSVLKMRNVKILIPMISAIASIIITFIAKLDFKIPISDIFIRSNIISLFEVVPVFLFIALYIYILIYGFIFVIKLVIQFITIFINNLDGYNSMNQVRINQLIIALRKHATIIVKND